VPTPSRFALAGLSAAAVLAGSAGCTGLGQANAAGVTRVDLVSELTTQLASSAGLTYTASYQLAGGETATVTQSRKPPRTAYAYPGGRMIITPGGTTRCTGGTCDERDPEPADDHSLPGLYTRDAVIALLNRAALDVATPPARHDTTMAGHHATCLTWLNPSAAVAPAADGSASPSPAGLTVCVTNEGALGRLSTTIGGVHTEMALTAYTDKADESAFSVPAGAHVTDHRSPASSRPTPSS
jgi:hypothetical protein